MGAYVACHIQNQRLKAHDDWELGHDGFKEPDGCGYAEAHDKQDEKPWKPLFHTAEDRFLQILLSGKTCQLCVVFIEFIPYDLNQIAGRDDADEPVFVVQHGDGVFGIIS